ncbi:MAG TPA: hypothetical protein VFN59_09630 [Acidimicrobiales bacterium]|nr:hypothetical protein [Acidimicrobiales bacterium]
MSAARAKARVVVDGSNIATEGRVTPSLAQLDEAVRAYIEENPGADVIVVVDATFEHRVPAAERAAFGEAVLAGEVVTPPAGAIGRGDAFILKIADRIGAVVLSNDSFQEFQEEYPWLFDEGRLVGGKPVRGVGWVFTTRLPVRNPKVLRQAKRAAKVVAPPEPTAKRAAKKATAKAPATPTKATVPAAKAPAKRAAKATPPAVAPPEPTAKRIAKRAIAAPPETTPEPAVALRRGRHPVNPESEFTRFLAAHRIGGRLTGEVVTFTSHGAVVTVEVRGGGRVECYAPTASLGSPPPARARDVLSRGERRGFTLVAVDPERRIAELALV